MNDRVDMRRAIVAKSDQLNADDLIGGPLTIKITGVRDTGAAEQFIVINYEGDGGKPYKPCKSMSRALVFVWGDNGADYVGRSMTLYNDPTVKWGGEEVGGIRISHMSHINAPMSFPLTATRGRKVPFTVQPLKTKATVEDHVAGYERAIANAADMSAVLEIVGSESADKLRAALEKSGKSELLERMKAAERKRNDEIASDGVEDELEAEEMAGDRDDGLDDDNSRDPDYLDHRDDDDLEFPE